MGKPSSRPRLKPWTTSPLTAGRRAEQLGRARDITDRRAVRGSRSTTPAPLTPHSRCRRSRRRRSRARRRSAPAARRRPLRRGRTGSRAPRAPGVRAARRRAPGVRSRRPTPRARPSSKRSIRVASIPVRARRSAFCVFPTSGRGQRSGARTASGLRSNVTATVRSSPDADATIIRSMIALCPAWTPSNLPIATIDSPKSPGTSAAPWNRIIPPPLPRFRPLGA